MNIKNEQYAIGLDIGTTKIVAMVGKKVQAKQFQIMGVGTVDSRGVKRGVVSNITVTTEAIKEAIEKAEVASGQKITEVFAGIAGNHIRSLQHQEYIMRDDAEAVITDKDIDLLKQQVQKINVTPGEEIIHIIPQEFMIDQEVGIKEPKGMCGRRLEGSFHVVVGQSTSIKNIARCIKSAGVKLTGLTLEPLASAEAVLSEEEKEAGVALVDIGGGTTDIAIFKDGVIRHTCVIPFGGNAITEDIKEGFSILGKFAEIIKVKYGSAWPDKNKQKEFVAIPGIRGGDKKTIPLNMLSQIIGARVEEVFTMVVDQLTSYGYNEHRKKLIAGIVLTGGGSELKDLNHLMELRSGLSTRIGYPNEHLIGETNTEVRRPLYATAVGLTIESEEYNKHKNALSLQEDQVFTDLDAHDLENEDAYEVNTLPKENSKEKSAENDNGSTDNKFKNIFARFIDKMKFFVETPDDDEN